jgi:hypothetical protein
VNSIFLFFIKEFRSLTGRIFGGEGQESASICACASPTKPYDLPLRGGRQKTSLQRVVATLTLPLHGRTMDLEDLSLRCALQKRKIVRATFVSMTGNCITSHDYTESKILYVDTDERSQFQTMNNSILLYPVIS